MMQVYLFILDQIANIIFIVAQIPDCQRLLITITVCYFLAVPSASLLFYLRVRAVFHDNRLVKGLFGLLWVAVLGGVITVPFAVKGVHIGPTQYCINSEVTSLGSITVVITTFNDTLVFFAIWYKLARSNNLMNETWRELASSFFKGNGFGSISKALYQGGQVFYLYVIKAYHTVIAFLISNYFYSSTVGMNLVTMITVLTPSAPPVYRAMVCAQYSHLKISTC
jgi:hypothetical protein